MPAEVLTTQSQIKCMHGASAILTTSNTKLTVAGAPALLETDVHPVAGCPFTLPGGKPSPCVRIEWSAGTTKMTSGGTKVLIRTSVGKCYSPESAMQGIAIIAMTQPKTTAT